MSDSSNIPRPPNSWILFRQFMERHGQIFLTSTSTGLKPQANKSKQFGKRWRELKVLDPMVPQWFEWLAKKIEGQHYSRYPDYQFVKQGKSGKKAKGSSSKAKKRLSCRWSREQVEWVLDRISRALATKDQINGPINDHNSNEAAAHPSSPGPAPQIHPATTVNATTALPTMLNFDDASQQPCYDNEESSTAAQNISLNVPIVGQQTWTSGLDFNEATRRFELPQGMGYSGLNQKPTTPLHIDIGRSPFSGVPANAEYAFTFTAPSHFQQTLLDDGGMRYGNPAAPIPGPSSSSHSDAMFTPTFDFVHASNTSAQDGFDAHHHELLNQRQQTRTSGLEATRHFELPKGMGDYELNEEPNAPLQADISLIPTNFNFSTVPANADYAVNYTPYNTPPSLPQTFLDDRGIGYGNQEASVPGPSSSSQNVPGFDARFTPTFDFFSNTPSTHFGTVAGSSLHHELNQELNGPLNVGVGDITADDGAYEFHYSSRIPPRSNFGIDNATVGNTIVRDGDKYVKVNPYSLWM
ncbi:hypothetical protein DXG03_002406 [Asterophora parasitica]|uniref:HMG box domain-containing protein n=1 Tax=Asterophora parasitica TaxID=117018 RepID=A0A9P7KER8_9AGAR|nr:hypothetical protein DXG03_002406 [Asterophora parasitica]